MTPPSPQPVEEQDLSIGQLLAMFWRGRWIVLGCVVLAGAAGFLMVLRRGTIWRATAELSVQPPRTANDQINEFFAALGGKNYAQSEADMLESDPILKRALGDEVLAYSTAFPETATTLAAKVEWLRESLDISVGRDDDVISVSMDSTDDVAAVELVNGVVSAYKDYTLDQQQGTAQSLLADQQQIDQSLNEKLKTAEDEIARLAKDHNLDPSSIELKSVASSIDRARIELARLLSRIQDVHDSIAGVANQRVDSPRLDAHVRLHRELQQHLLTLLAQFTPEHPAVQQIERRIAVVETDLVAEIEGVRADRRADFDRELATLEAQRGELEAQLQQDNERFTELNNLQIRFMSLFGEAQVLREQRKDLVGQINMLETLVAKTTENAAASVTIRRTPTLGQLKDVSGRSTRLALSILVGLFFGAGIVWLRELLDQRIRSADEATRLLDLPLLGAMPRVAPLQGETESEALTRWETDRIYAEAARSLRTQVYFGLPADEGRIIQLTSPDQGDGKSTTASHLAIAMAKAGQRTLLIDADLRRPRQAEIFGVSKSPGLSDLLSGQFAGEALPTRPSGIEGLDILPAGRVPPNPAEMLNHQRFADLLEEAGKHYDRIVIDSPPVLPVADASILAPRADTTILVLRAERSTRKRAEVALQTLRRVGGSVLGIVLNDVSRAGGYGRRYGYGYGYYASRYEQDQPEDVPRGTRPAVPGPKTVGAAQGDSGRARRGSRDR